MGDMNSYEEVRKRRVQDNLKHLEKLGIATLAKGLVVATQKEHKQRFPSIPKEKRITEDCDIRRSSRARHTAVTYTDEFFDPEPQYRRRRTSTNHNVSEDRAYKGRIASHKQKLAAIKRAEIFQGNLNHSSFIKPMVRSHVSSCFWLGLPRSFCKVHLPESGQSMVLEDENGEECDAVYIGKRTGLSGGWRGFALEHDLEDGDALIFELTEPAKFKVYIFKAVVEESTALEMIEEADAKEEKVPVLKTESSKGGKNKGRKALKCKLVC